MKILIADDERLTCEFLTKVIEDIGDAELSVVGTASNGPEALEKISEHSPDVLLLDIQMPGCNGIEVLEEIKRCGGKTVTIIISAYREFEYAQKALAGGAFAYLLKPVERHKLFEQLTEAGVFLQNRAKIQAAMAFSDHLLCQKTFQKLVTQIPLNIEEERRVKECLGGASYRIALLRTNFPLDELLCCEVASWLRASHEVFLSEQEYLAFLSEKTVDQLLVQERPDFLSSRGYFVLGLSLSAHSCATVYSGYQEAWRALECTYFCDKWVMVCPAASESHLVRLDAKALIDCILRGNLEAADKLLLQYSMELCQANSATKAQVVHGLFAALCMLREERGILRKCPRLQNISFEQLMQCPTLAQCIALCQSLFHQVVTQADSVDMTDEERIVRRVQTYCEKNYSSDIGLDQICGHVYLSKSYLCQLFKHQTGQSIWDYLTELRMKNARRLLRETEIKVAQIAQMLGYKNASHFGKVFKKLNGISPNEYKRRMFD